MFRFQASAELHVNNASLLILSYDAHTTSEAVFSPNGQMLVNVSYDRAGQGIHYQPLEPLQPATISYNPWGYVNKTQRGNVVEVYMYDLLQRQKAIIYGDNTTMSFNYKDRRTNVSNNLFRSICS